MKSLAERIKALRMPGETQVQFAERLGTTQASVSRYLSGRSPDRETLVKIARRTGVSLDWLLTGEGPMTLPEGLPKLDDRTLVQAVTAYLGSLKGISSRDKERLGGLVRELVEDKSLREEILKLWEEKKRSRKK